MTRSALLTTFGLVLALAAPARAQDHESVLLVIDAGSTSVDSGSVGRAIAGAIDRPVLRMTDERAASASGRLTIAFSNPDRWVLHYESRGRTGWISDRIEPSAVRARLTELSVELVNRVEATAASAEAPAAPAGAAAARRETIADVIHTLQSEIIDPFEGEPRRTQTVAVMWSEVIDPFGPEPRRVTVRDLRSEVLDPWARPRR